MRVVLPKTMPNLKDLEQIPMFFLAGPILGGGDWQAKISELLTKEVGDCIIVNPSRYNETHPHFKFALQGRKDVFERQTDWERYFLRQAAKEWGGGGCIIFWLPCESRDEPRKDGLPYAMDTRGELGEWRGHLVYDKGLRVLIGAEKGFPGLKTIERNFCIALDLDSQFFHFLPSIKELVHCVRYNAYGSIWTKRNRPSYGTVLFERSGNSRNF